MREKNYKKKTFIDKVTGNYYRKCDFLIQFLKTVKSYKKMVNNF